MKFYFNKKNNEITIISSPNEECPNVVFVQDRGKEYGKQNRPKTNIFGGRIERYMFHVASIHDGYSSNTDDIKWILEDCERISLTKTIKRKVKVKL